MSFEQRIHDAWTLGKLCEASYHRLLRWMTESDYRDYRDELQDLIQRDQWPELDDRFYKIIEFGTGGRRGTRGAGTNRINMRTIAESAQGLSEYIHEAGDPDLGIVVAFDTRHLSREFAQEAASVFASNGIHTYIYEEPRSTPQLSFSIRHLHTQAGCMISASHNPPADNGIKVSWNDGGQVLPPHDTGIIQKVLNVSAIRKMLFSEAIETGKITILDDTIDQAYIGQLKTLSLSDVRGAKIAYSPLHGVGATNVVRLLKELHFDLITADQQMIPDPDFSSVKNRLPNPELPEAMELVTELARANDAAVAIASDPDADRLGVTVPCPSSVHPDGWIFLTGNQIGVLILDHIIRRLTSLNVMSNQSVVIKTIVTTEMLDAICSEHGVEVIKDLLVGFKYIAEVTEQLPSEKTLIFQTEESHGYNRGTFVRDKDAAAAALYISELACELTSVGRNIYQHLNDLYRRYGYFCEVTRSVFYPGKTGMETMMRIMDMLRHNPPHHISDYPVYRIIDRLTNDVIDPTTGQVIKLSSQHKGNVMIYHFDPTGLNRITARPSGTEPKIKFYAQLWAPVPENTGDPQLEQLKSMMHQKANRLIDAIASLDIPPSAS